MTEIEKLVLLETYSVVCCGGCGISFAITSGYELARRDDHKTFYCPNGCARAWMSESNSERLRRIAGEANDALARERARLDQTKAYAETLLRRAAAARGQVTRIRNRVANGVCPCCNRSFRDLAAHMSTKHPSYTGGR